mgnify:CR=1 FL=1
MSLKNSQPFKVGKYLITPLSQLTAHGLHLAKVSIRNGSGSASHDRVFTFTSEFQTRDAALIYAAGQGRHWLVAPRAFC